MRKTTLVLACLLALGPATSVRAQDTSGGFVITLKNGSKVQGRTLSRDDATGRLRLTMSESASGEAKSYAIIAAEDTAEIKSSASDSDSIRIKLKGGSDLRCKEFSLNGESVSVKLGAASRIDVRWTDIESISFAQ